MTETNDTGELLQNPEKQPDWHIRYLIKQLTGGSDYITAFFDARAPKNIIDNPFQQASDVLTDVLLSKLPNNVFTNRDILLLRRCVEVLSILPEEVGWTITEIWSTSPIFASLTEERKNAFFVLSDSKVKILVNKMTEPRGYTLAPGFRQLGMASLLNSPNGQYMWERYYQEFHDVAVLMVERGMQHIHSQSSESSAPSDDLDREDFMTVSKKVSGNDSRFEDIRNVAELSTQNFLKHSQLRLQSLEINKNELSNFQFFVSEAAYLARVALKIA